MISFPNAASREEKPNNLAADALINIFLRLRRKCLDTIFLVDRKEIFLDRINSIASIKKSVIHRMEYEIR
jgi:hypothetical protein